jgi:O-antigen/teichoic acid export membrane protein
VIGPLPEEAIAAIASDLTVRARRRRWVGLRAAILTGGIAKVLSVMVQLLAIGVAVRALGPDAFGAYLVIASLVAWLGLAAVGVGPGLTQRMAIASATSDVAAQAKAFSSSVAVAGAVIGAAALVVIVGAWTLVGGRGDPGFDADIATAVLLLTSTTAVQTFLSVVEAAQLGHQEQYVANSFQAVGLAVVMVILLVVGGSLTTVTQFVLATVGPPLLARLVNCVIYVARRRYLLTRHVSVREAARVLNTSVAFAAVQLGATASQQLGFLWLAFVAGPAAAIPIGLMFRLNGAVSGVVALGTQPLWPAMADAVAHADTRWAKRAYRRASRLTAAFAIVYAVGLVTVGSAVIDAWTGTRVEIPLLMQVLFGAYFVVGVWAHINAITLVGLGKVWTAARVTLAEAVAASLGAIVLVAQLGATGVILALLIASTALGAILLPRAVQRSWPEDPTARLLVRANGSAVLL